MMLALALALLSGAMLAALICKGIRLKLWLDVAVGIGAALATWASAVLAGSDPWPLAGIAGGFACVVGYLRFKGAEV